MYQQYITGVIAFIITFSGIFINLSVIYAINKTPSMSGSFGIITKSQVVCNMIMCSIYILFVLPLQLSSLSHFIPISHYFGTAAQTVYIISNLSHFLNALNRCCALFMPLWYTHIFSNSKTVFYRNFIWIFSIIFCITLYEFFKCFLLYAPKSWSFQFVQNPVCNQITWYLDFNFNCSIIIITLIIDLLVAFVGRKHSKTLPVGSEYSKVLRKRDWNFVRQTSSQGFNNFVGVLAFYIVAPRISDEWIILKFFVISLWVFMHAFDGAIIIISNHELRAVFEKKSVILVAPPSRNPSIIGANF
ncbi:7TM GPCR serpentine receptor class x (Srx) domain-containing protein [Caenorhabditis elegans]|uniref:7TM GPCR serpentine receptor class x (Srx) domain-containing protein n=1 Tax=Caenorhabditis elegans TaxID=6239 RepID=Q9N5G6_CAEEL|nr:7TM GPCR serpentine receptor class x (Srx) domain-containing protein [Caenorhabditis elegans]CCD65480.2 7TM GPCR serpentine receptor class x (Srx) domain-containing protein [Caenorhabditis elegans]|eukprot:NP_503749.3 Serpentine Receptor, class X [Caenorhabditis elegans]